MTNTAKHPALSQSITDQPAVYVGTYGKYNSGSLAGAWVDLTQVSSKDEFYEICAELHKDEEDPEYMFQDWQSIPSEFIGECWIDEEFFEYLEKAAGMDEDTAEALQIWLNDGHEITSFEDAYRGKWDSEEAYAEDLIGQCYDLNKMIGNLSYYFDYEKFARDLFINDCWFENGHVFDRNY